MNILEAIMAAQSGAAVRQAGSQVGLGQEQTASALSALVPALAAGFQRNMQSEGGLGSLVSALAAGNHQQYIDNPASLGDGSALADGNGILGHVFGSKDVSRAVAAKAAAQTGLSPDVLKRLLPLAATMMMGAMSRQSGGAATQTSGLPGGGGALTDMLTPLLDKDRDGSIADDVIGGLIGRLTGRS